MAANRLKYPFIDGLKDVPKDKRDDVREIKTWLETQPQLPKLNEEFLHLFLHSNYYNMEEAKSNILAYVSLRSTSPELFSDRSLSNPATRKMLDMHLYGFAPKRTPEGYQVVFLTIDEKKMQDFVHLESIKTSFILFDIMTSEFGLCPGYIIVYDTKAFTLSLFFKLHFGAIMKLTRYFQEAAPVRVKNLICLNSVSLVDRLMSMFRPFLRSSLISKLQFYSAGSDLTNFFKTVPQECVFDEYGGTAGSIKVAHERLMNLFDTKYSRWIEDESIYAVEKPTVEPTPKKRFSFW